MRRSAARRVLEELSISMKFVQCRNGASDACLNDWVDVSGEDIAEERGPRHDENNADKSSEANDPRLLLPPRELRQVLGCEYLACCCSGRWPTRRIDDEAQSCRPHHEESDREPRGDVVGYDHPRDGNKREREQPPPLRLSCVN